MSALDARSPATSRPATDPTADPPPIALRIVVDGASTAGKTTTARALGARLGRPVTTPEEEAGRTLLFDWMDHVGGRSDGRAIRTQVVAVPGHLPHLRARLLVTADVILFVADTSAAAMGDTLAALAQVRELLEAMPQPRPGLLVQANKRDHPTALPLAEVRRQLGLDEDELLIETVATDGEGVRQSFVYAVRLGLQHVRAASGPRVAERQRSPEDLLAELDTDPRTIDEIAAERAAAAAAGQDAPVGQGPVVDRQDADDEEPALTGAHDGDGTDPPDDGRAIDEPTADDVASDDPWAALQVARRAARGEDEDEDAADIEATDHEAEGTDPTATPEDDLDAAGSEAAAEPEPVSELGRWGVRNPEVLVRRPPTPPPWRRWLDRS